MLVLLSPLFIFVSLAGWLVPIIFILVSLMAGTIFLGAAISVLDGLYDQGQAAGGSSSHT